MSLKTVFIINAIIAGFFALVSLIIPVTLLSSYGVESNAGIVLMTRFFGVTLLAIALATFYLKNSSGTTIIEDFRSARRRDNADGA